MAWSYRVVDLTTEVINPIDTIIETGSPEEAARLVLGFDVRRGGPKQDLVARCNSAL